MITSTAITSATGAAATPTNLEVTPTGQPFGSENSRAIALFHLAFPVADLAQTKAFYMDGLGCTAGREGPNSLILNCYGNQIVAHVSPGACQPQKGIYPRHFGLVFAALADWQALIDRAEAKQLTFEQTPRRRFPGEQLEHYTAFLADPFHNLLEFKHYVHPEAIFGAVDDQRVGDR
ncbi:VOC family protein [Limnothrix sp. FACHB-881]|nr:VOC family protein [Limnothrix sp. FACHB-881]